MPPGDGGPPAGVDSAMLASMQQAGSSGGAGAAVGSMGTGLTTSQNTFDTFGQSASMDANFAYPGYQSAFFTGGGGAFENNLCDIGEGNMAIGSINHNAWDANQMGFGDISAGNFVSPANNLNAKVPSMRGQEGGQTMMMG